MCATTAINLDYQSKIFAGLKGRHFLSLLDFHQQELKQILNLSEELKQNLNQGKETNYLPGKTLGMVFEKPSTRTRVSFQTGIYQLGGTGMFLSKNDLQLARKEPIKDTARVLSSYLDGIMVRTFSHDLIEEFAHYSSVPVINGLTDTFHPCQVMADLMTIKEEFGDFKGLKVAYLGDGNNMTNSLMIGCAKMGLEIAVASPKGKSPDEKVVEMAKAEAALYGGKVTVTDSPEKALKGSHVVTTDVWVSMGNDESDADKIKEEFTPYQLNQKAMNLAEKNAIVLHCLPAHRGEEITGDVLEGKQSRVFQQAENRLHVQKGIMTALMG